jgi:hypothetical protein
MQDKPAVIIDDDLNWSKLIGRGIRKFGGLSVVHFPSIETFLEHHSVQLEDNKELTNILRTYSTVVCDNNLKGTPGALLEGIDFLWEHVGPASQQIEASQRPVLVCFAPSNEGTITQFEYPLWNKFNIASFHKLIEFPAIGIDVRIAREYGAALNRKTLIESVLRQPLDLNGNESDNPKRNFFMDLQFDHLESPNFKNDDFHQIEGDAEPIAWEELLNSLANRLHIKPNELQESIEKETGSPRLNSIEGKKGKEL